MGMRPTTAFSTSSTWAALISDGVLAEALTVGCSDNIGHYLFLAGHVTLNRGITSTSSNG